VYVPSWSGANPVLISSLGSLSGLFLDSKLKISIRIVVVVVVVVVVMSNGWKREETDSDIYHSEVFDICKSPGT